MDRAVKEKIVVLSHVATWILAISRYMAFNYIPAVGIVMINQCGFSVLKY